MKTAKDYQQEFRLKDDELAQFDEFLNNPKHTCFHGKEYLIYKLNMEEFDWQIFDLVREFCFIFIGDSQLN